jgi:serine/threonine protein kinase
LLIIFTKAIVHCDVKPNNVLVFRHPTEGFTVKLADFGYATSARHNQVYLATPAIWSDPDYRGDAVDMITAQRMESYSFGLLCTWLFCRTPNSNVLLDSTKSSSLLDDSLSLDRLFAMLDERSDLSCDQLKQLERVLSVTLATDRGRRTKHLAQVVSILEPNRSAPMSDDQSTKITNDDVLSSTLSDLKVSSPLSDQKFKVRL